jgi:hypothetical protein
LWDRKTPDFRGIWQVRDTAYLNIEGHPAKNGVAAAKSIVVDPPNGKIPYKPEALARREENYNIEDECLEDANGVRHHISSSDPRNLLKSDYSRWIQHPAT